MSMRNTTSNKQAFESCLLPPARSSGFTLIEAMVAITILSLSIAGPLFGASRAIVLAQISRDQLISSYLAQEGIEYLRAMRDDAYLNSYKNGGANISTAAWTDFISGASTWSITQCVARLCTLDPARPMGYGNTFALNAYTGAAPLFLSNGIYTQQQIGTQTLFTRTIQATAVSGTEEVITSTVTWTSHSIPYTVTIIDHLTPWQ